MQSLNKSLGFYDLFIIRDDGTVLYTVEKESDFGTNLRTGPFHDSGLAQLFNKALGSAGTVLLQDFPHTRLQMVNQRHLLDNPFSLISKG